MQCMEVVPIWKEAKLLSDREERKEAAQGVDE
jgi:hypothetical protein